MKPTPNQTADNRPARTTTTAPRGTVPALLLVGLVPAAINSLGVPLVPTMAEHFDIPVSTAQGSVTINLVAAVVAMPLLGRIGESNPRDVIALLLGLVVIGGLVCVLTSDFEGILLGRAMQGVGAGVIPLGMTLAKRSLAPPQAIRTVGLLSVAVGIGAAVAFPLSASTADEWGLRAAFATGTTFALLVLLASVLVLPRPRQPRVRINLVGTSLLGSAVSALVLAASSGPTLGVVPSIGIAVAGLAVLAVWTWLQLQAEDPVIDLRRLTVGTLGRANCCSFLVGSAMYMTVSTMSLFTQADPESGGLGLSAATAGLLLVPYCVGMLPGALVAPRLSRWVSLQALQTGGCIVLAAALAVFSTRPSDFATVAVLQGIVGVGSGLALATIPQIITRDADPARLNSALAFSQLLRYIGFAAGSAAAVAVLGSQPLGASYTRAALCCCGTYAATALITLLPVRRRAAAAAASF